MINGQAQRFGTKKTHIIYRTHPPELETICRQDGGINEPDSPDAYGRFFSADSLIYVNPRIGVKRTQELLATAYRTFYFRPTTILRHLALLRDWRYALSLTRSIGLFLGL